MNIKRRRNHPVVRLSAGGSKLRLFFFFIAVNHEFWFGNQSVWIHVFGSVYLTPWTNQIGKLKRWSVSEQKNVGYCVKLPHYVYGWLLYKVFCVAKMFRCFVFIVFWGKRLLQGLRGEMLAWRMSPSSGHRPAWQPPHSVCFTLDSKKIKRIMFFKLHICTRCLNCHLHSQKHLGILSCFRASCHRPWPQACPIAGSSVTGNKIILH